MRSDLSTVALIACLCAGADASPSFTRADVASVDWLIAIDGLWRNGKNWSGGVAPGQSASDPADVRIGALGAPFVVQLDDERFVGSLEVSGGAATLRVVTGGVLNVADVATLASRLELVNGQLRAGTWTFANGVGLSGAANRMTGVTIDAAAPVVFSRLQGQSEATAIITGGLTVLNGPLTLNGVRLNFIDQTSTVDFDAILQGGELLNSAPLGTLTLSSGRTVSGSGKLASTGGGDIIAQGLIRSTGLLTISMGTGTLVNEGAIEIESGALVQVTSGSLDNQGRISGSNARLDLYGSNSVATFGELEFSNSVLALHSGVIRPDDGRLVLHGQNELLIDRATLLDTTVVSDGGLTVMGDNQLAGRLENVAFNGGDVRLSTYGKQVVLAGAIDVSDGMLFTTHGVGVDGAATLRSGTLSFGLPNGQVDRGVGVLGAMTLLPNSSFTIGEDADLRIGMTNVAVLSSGASNDPRSFTNLGALNVRGGAELDVTDVSTFVNRGVVNVGEAGLFTFGASRTGGTARNEGLMTVAGGGTLEAAANWLNAGTIDIEQGGAMLISGDFTTESIGDIRGFQRQIILSAEWTGDASVASMSDLGPNIEFRRGGLRNGIFDFAGTTVTFDEGQNGAATFGNVALLNADLDMGIARVGLEGLINLDGGIMRLGSHVGVADAPVFRDGDFVLRDTRVSRLFTTDPVLEDGATLRGFGEVLSPGASSLRIRAGARALADGGDLDLGRVVIDQGGTIESVGSGSRAIIGAFSTNRGDIVARDGGAVTISELEDSTGAYFAYSGGSIDVSQATTTGAWIADGGTISADNLVSQGSMLASPGGEISVHNLVNEGDIHVNGGTLRITNSLRNTGSVLVSSGDAIFHAPSHTAPWTNTGTIEFDGSRLILADTWRSEDFEGFSLTNTTLRIADTLVNVASAPLDLTGVTRMEIDGNFYANMAPIDLSGIDISLEDASMHGTFANAHFRVTRDASTIGLGELMLENSVFEVDARDVLLNPQYAFVQRGLINFLPGASGRIGAATLPFALTGDSEIVAEDLVVELRARFTNGATIRAFDSTPDATAPGIVFGLDAAAIVGEFLNEGAFIADGGRITIGPEQSGGANQGVRLVNLNSNGVFASGDWIARDGGVIDLSGRTFPINTANLRIEGRDSRFEAMRHILLNTGEIEIVDHEFASTAPILTNAEGGLIRFESAHASVQVISNSGHVRLAESSIVEATSLALSSTSVLQFTLSDAQDASELVVTGDASLAGDLVVEFAEGFNGAWGDTWNLLSASSFDADFDEVMLPTLDAPFLLWEAAIADGVYSATVHHAVDLDRSLAIDFGDLNIVLSTFGLAGAEALGDTNGDGVVDFNDVNAVLSFYGLTPDERAVPAPAVSALLGVRALGGLRRRRRTR